MTAAPDALMGIFGFKRVESEMKTDRELLELAAKAAGIEIVNCSCSYEEWPFKYAVGQARRGHWNPLADDGDALRLAVVLRIDIYHHTFPGEVEACGDGGSAHEERHGNLHAATRRAIVRAAAAIGESMQ